MDECHRGTLDYLKTNPSEPGRGSTDERHDFSWPTCRTRTQPWIVPPPGGRHGDVMVIIRTFRAFTCSSFLFYQSKPFLSCRASFTKSHLGARIRLKVCLGNGAKCFLQSDKRELLLPRACCQPGRFVMRETKGTSKARHRRVQLPPLGLRCTRQFRFHDVPAQILSCFSIFLTVKI